MNELYSYIAFIGYYDTMDAGYVDEDGYVFVVARDDDVINVAGHRYDEQKFNRKSQNISKKLMSIFFNMSINYSYNL